MHVYQIVGLVVCTIIFIIITLTIFSKKHVLSYQHVAGYAILILAILLILRLVELTFDPEKKILTIKGIQEQIESLSKEVNGIQEKVVFLDYSGLSVADNISVEVRDNIVSLYDKVRMAIEERNLDDLASLYSESYLKGELDNRAAIEGWKDHLGKQIFFYLREISIEKDSLFKVEGSVIMLEDKRQWSFEDFVSIENGQYRFKG